MRFRFAQRTAGKRDTKSATTAHLGRAMRQEICAGIYALVLALIMGEWLLKKGYNCTSACMHVAERAPKHTFLCRAEEDGWAGSIMPRASQSTSVPSSQCCDRNSCMHAAHESVTHAPLELSNQCPATLVDTAAVSLVNTSRWSLHGTEVQQGDGVPCLWSWGCGAAGGGAAKCMPPRAP